MPQEDVQRFYTNFYGEAQKSVKTYQQVKTNYFEDLLLLKSKSVELTKVR